MAAVRALAAAAKRSRLRDPLPHCEANCLAMRRPTAQGPAPAWRRPAIYPVCGGRRVNARSTLPDGGPKLIDPAPPVQRYGRLAPAGGSTPDRLVMFPAHAIRQLPLGRRKSDEFVSRRANVDPNRLIRAPSRSFAPEQLRGQGG